MAKKLARGYKPRHDYDWKAALEEKNNNPKRLLPPNTASSLVALTLGALAGPFTRVPCCEGRGVGTCGELKGARRSSTGLVCGEFRPLGRIACTGRCVVHEACDCFYRKRGGEVETSLPE